MESHQHSKEEKKVKTKAYIRLHRVMDTLLGIATLYCCYSIATDILKLI